MNTLFTLLFGLVLFAAVPAQAATLASSVLGTGVGFALTDTIGAANVNIGNLPLGDRYETGVVVGTAVMDVSNATTVKGNLEGQYKRPLGVGVNDTYLSVFGSPNGAATFTVNGMKTTLDFSWGTIDSYNKLEVWDKNDVKYTVTGSMLDAALPSIVLGTTGHYFTFTAMSGIAKFVLSSTSNSFEAANFRLSNVPLPAALPLFGFALLGLAGLKARKKVA